ncbi:MAG: lipid-A-disaccharide synthase [Xanthomonadales bacterium]|nr:lipid-A-disaccharide synthase [Xanthomonadales bacterium]
MALIAGEASGDQLGGELASALAARWPGAQLAGVGGPRMAAAGVQLWSDYAPLAVMGLFEVLRHLPRLLRFRRSLLARLADWRPDLVVGIDAPDFNLGLEARMKRVGVATAHYVSPSVWAWRERRAARMATSVDRVLCLFPMEPAIYARHGVDARFVGHPLADRFPHRSDRDAARQALGVEPGAAVLAVLPGSRLGEIRRLAPPFLAAARALRADRPDLAVLVPAANPACRAALEQLLTAGSDPGIRLVDGQGHAALVASDVVLLASGTAALEAALAKRPMVVGYRIAGATYTLVRALRLLKISRFSLPNVLADAALVPELIQHDCEPLRIRAELERLLDQAEARDRQVAGFDAIHARLGAPGGSAAAAAAALDDLLGRTRP